MAEAAQAGQFRDFCAVFVAHFVDETDPHRRFERVARLMVEELGRPGADQRYTGTLDNAITALRAALKPTLEQEELWVIAPAFFRPSLTPLATARRWSSRSRVCEA